MALVKICGLTNRADAEAAAALGADAVGLVFAPSPRRVDLANARAIREGLPPWVVVVGVFVNQPLDEVRRVREWCGLDLVQLHGDEPPSYLEALGGPIIKSLAMGPGTVVDPRAYAGATLLLDTAAPGARGGTGRCFDWSLARPVARERRVILAGGLGPDNVRRAIEQVKPYAVDVSSGVEIKPGRKDHAAMAQFITQAKQ